jgi:hypothetical protein
LQSWTIEEDRMDASTLKHAADTVTERLVPVAETVTEKLAPVAETVTEKLAPVAETVTERLGELGDAAYRLAALTPWVEAPTSAAWRRWLPRFAVLAAIVGLGLLLANRKRSTADYRPEEDASAAADETGRRLAAAGS